MAHDLKEVLSVSNQLYNQKLAAGYTVVKLISSERACQKIIFYRVKFYKSTDYTFKVLLRPKAVKFDKNHKVRKILEYSYFFDVTFH